jgi:hypothetical protein
MKTLIAALAAALLAGCASGSPSSDRPGEPPLAPELRGLRSMGFAPLGEAAHDPVF